MTEPTSNDRKICPHCGHSNRLNAKVCTECGQPFILIRATGMLRKRCPNCGHENRLRAKVCSQCGQAFPMQIAAKRASVNAKWCPQCGAKHKPGAKVCSNCGYRFESTQPSTPPIVQMPQPAITRKPAPPPPVKLPPDLKGEPAPYLSSEELNKLRQSETYHANVFIRPMTQTIKKDRT